MPTLRSSDASSTLPSTQLAWALLTESASIRTCGLATHPEPQRRRKPRGNRPYVPLSRILGAERAAAHHDTVTLSSATHALLTPLLRTEDPV